MWESISDEVYMELEMFNLTANLFANTNRFNHTNDSIIVNGYFKTIFFPMLSKIEKIIYRPLWKINFFHLPSFFPFWAICISNKILQNALIEISFCGKTSLFFMTEKMIFTSPWSMTLMLPYCKCRNKGFMNGFVFRF